MSRAAPHVAVGFVQPMPELSSSEKQRGLAGKFQMDGLGVHPHAALYDRSGLKSDSRKLVFLSRN